MRTSAAAAGSSVFFACAPAVVAGVVPWSLTRWEAGGGTLDLAPLRIVGAVVLGVAVVVLVQAFVRFVVEGAGTSAPVAPPEHLVIGGLYRHVRNPMYVAVVAAVVAAGLTRRNLRLIGAR